MTNAKSLKTEWSRTTILWDGLPIFWLIILKSIGVVFPNLWNEHSFFTCLRKYYFPPYFQEDLDLKRVSKYIHQTLKLMRMKLLWCWLTWHLFTTITQIHLHCCTSVTSVSNIIALLYCQIMPGDDYLLLMCICISDQHHRVCQAVRYEEGVEWKVQWKIPSCPDYTE